MLQFVAKLSSLIMYSQHIPEWERLGLQQIVFRRWWEFSPLSLSSIGHSYPRHTLIDTPELVPGSTPRPSVPSSHSTSGLKVGLIASSIVGGIAAITLLVVVLFFYRRRRRSLASFAAPPVPESAGDNLSAFAAFNTPMLPVSAGDNLSAFVAFNTPMLSHIPSRASSSRNTYTVSPVPPPQPH
jgi:hypothetical protein